MAPRPLSIETLGVAVPVTDQERVAEPPAVIVVGFAEKEMIDGAVEVALTPPPPAGFTVTVVSAVAVPPAFVAVRVYVVVTDGETEMDDCPRTEPTPLLMESAVGLFVVVQERVARFPVVMEVEFAEKEEMAGAGMAFVVKVKSGEVAKEPPAFADFAAK